MEQSGRNPWQPVANAVKRYRRNQAKAVARGCDRLPIGAHGKEGGQRFEYVRGLRKGLHMPERNRVGVPVAGVRRLAVGRRSPTVLLLEHDARGCVAA
jgi:hypothetical protein